MNAAIHPRKVAQRKRADDRADHSAQCNVTINITSFPSGLEWMAIAWSDDALEGIVFGHPSRRAAEDAVLRMNRLARHACQRVAMNELGDAPPWVRRLVEDLQRFTDGEPVDFSSVPIAQNHLTPFARRVVAACRRIGWGQVKSYGELAAKCGAPGAARAVGSVMAKNRFPLVVPCHRVLAAGGRIGGYSAPGRLATKRRLLAMEAGSR